MRKRVITYTIFAFLLPALAFGQGIFTSKNYSISGNPKAGSYKLQTPEYRDLQLVNGYPTDKTDWIVYSDRADNPTFVSPNSEVRFKSLSFMQPCYVVNSKDDFLQLVKYVPGISTKGGKISGQSAEELGWVPASSMLLWNSSLKDKSTGYHIKAVTALGTERIFTTLPGHVDRDSILLFANPFLNIRNGSSFAGDLFYIYKESPSGNEFLVGPEPGFFPDKSTSSGLGWISKDLLRVWGKRGFITYRRTAENRNMPHIPLYKEVPAVRDTSSVPLTVAMPARGAVAGELDELFPTWQYATGANFKKFAKVGVLTDVMDRKLNEVQNLAGRPITYESLQKIVDDNSRLNIVFVVDGGRQNMQYLNQLQNILQSAVWQNTAKGRFNQVKVGSVIYKDNIDGCVNKVSPLTPDIKKISDFWMAEQQLNSFSCSDNKPTQAVFSGIADATRMLMPYKDESNIIVLYGSAGEAKTTNLANAISGISFTNSRLLIFQTHSIADPSYNNFIVQARNMVEQSARNISDIKKSKMVEFASSSTGSDFTLMGNNMGVYYLDYPAKSMTQGFVVFPNRGEIMAPTFLETSLDTLIQQINSDNLFIENSLYRAFATVGSRGTTINPRYAYLFPSYNNKPLPAEYLKANTLRKQNFMINAWAPVNDEHSVSSGLLLSPPEYLNLTSQLFLLGGKSLPPTTKKAIAKQIENAVEKTRKKGKDLNKSASSLTFSEVMEYLTGYYPIDSTWMYTTINNFKSNKKVNVDHGVSFLAEASKAATWFQDNINNPAIQLRNNGKVYYVLTDRHLPVNTVKEEKPVVKEEVKTVTSQPEVSTPQQESVIKEDEPKPEKKTKRSDRKNKKSD